MSGPYTVMISKTAFTGESQRCAVHEMLQGITGIYDVNTWISRAGGRHAKTNKAVILFTSCGLTGESLQHVTQQVVSILPSDGDLLLCIEDHSH